MRPKMSQVKFFFVILSPFALRQVSNHLSFCNNYTETLLQKEAAIQIHFHTGAMLYRYTVIQVYNDTLTQFSIVVETQLSRYRIKQLNIYQILKSKYLYKKREKSCPLFFFGMRYSTRTLQSKLFQNPESLSAWTQDTF